MPGFPRQQRHSKGMALVPQPHGGAVNRFEKGKSGNPFGPPRKLTSQVLADLKAAGYERVGPSSVTEASEQLIGVPESVLRSIQKDPDQPVFMRILAETLLRKKGRFEAVQVVLDRAHGKAKQQVDLSGAGAIPVPTVTVVVQAVNPNGGQG